MKFNSLRWLAVAAVVLLGCEHDCYEVEIRPDDGGFERRITCWHEGGKNDEEIIQLSSEKLAAIASIYPKRETPGDAKKQTFSGRFVGKTPNDVGGAGRLTKYESPMGDAWSYIERFRGNDDIEATLAKKRKAADRLIDLLIGWATAELGKEPGFPELKKFLDVNLRQDLKNLGLYIWTLGTANIITLEEEYCNEQLWSRIGLYLCERGYFEMRDLPRLLRSDYGECSSHFQRLIARQMGVPNDQPIPDKLKFIADQSKLESSLNIFRASTDEYKKQLTEWKKKLKNNPDTKKPKPSAVFDDLFGKAVFELSFVTPDSLEVKLRTGRKPYSTNGDWNENIAVVMWSNNIAANDAPPIQYFAYWSEPNKEFQKQHFGDIVLNDKSLGEYVFWYCSLKPAEVAEWDRFIGGLNPDADWKSVVKDFRFSFDPKPDLAEPNKSVTSLADKPRSLLLPDDNKK